MLFNKSLLSAWFLAQALLQTSVYADEPKTKVQSYNVPAATNSVNGAIHNNNRYNDNNKKCNNGDKFCSSEKNGYEECIGGVKAFIECRADQKCVALNGPVAMCALRNDFKCKNGKKTCSSDSRGYDECVNNTLVFHRCGINEFCSVSNNKTKCGPRKNNNNDSKCFNGDKFCSSEKNGYEECIGGIKVFRECRANEKCVALNGPEAGCALRNDFKCNNGEKTCKSDSTGYDECVNNTLVFHRCGMNEFCGVSNNVTKCCPRKNNNNDSKCNNGDKFCSSEKNGYEECIGGVKAFIECRADQKSMCALRNDFKCKNGKKTCSSDSRGYDECVNNTLVFHRCGINEFCSVSNNKTKCGPRKNNNNDSKCNNGDKFCISEKNGYEECIGGIKVFRECRANEKCVALNGPEAGCALRNDFKCNNGEKTCKSDSTGYDECVNNTLVFHRCGMNEFCGVSNNHRGYLLDRKWNSRTHSGCSTVQTILTRISYELRSSLGPYLLCLIS
ncbi:hypothetical protein BB561_004396 [Smittium simulii]|uniref:Dickkopf N-terminal cysteine-rich domain-containing protein n=1 Tax=Smittium simulii TaxID=133385 RepID=A0A2T9YGI2_9FUNG|nr:hypothetical protein BB561_004396 [Smittium simulii]